MFSSELLLLFTLVSWANAGQSPNFVIFLTDDQDIVLDGMKPMDNVRRFIQDKGVTFTNSFTTCPICCPSRSSFLTGMYLHNHKTFNNSISGGCYSEAWRKVEENAFANILRQAGYRTFYAGKYLNQYGTLKAGGPEHVPVGWSDWHGLVGNSVYYNYILSNNGVPTFSDDLYLTDVIRDLSLDFLSSMRSNEPFLMVLAPPAPHQPFVPAPRHTDVYRNVTALKRDNFNIAVNDKHWLMSMPPSPLPKSMLPGLDKVYRRRWESLLSVDEMVGDVVSALEYINALNNTYLIYTSDNGYHVGQFAQVYDKRQPYESDIKVPLVMSGPGLTHQVKDDPVINVDVAPTILHLAGLTPPDSMDGRVFNFNKENDERYMLIEYYGEGNTNTVDDDCQWKYDGQHLSECKLDYSCKCQDSKNNTFACVRHIGDKVDYKYCEFKQKEIFYEVYDLKQDPLEMKNIAEEIFPYVKYWYSVQLANLMACKGVKECDQPLQPN